MRGSDLSWDGTIVETRRRKLTDTDDDDAKLSDGMYLFSPGAHIDLVCLSDAQPELFQYTASIIVTRLKTIFADAP